MSTTETQLGRDIIVLGGSSGGIEALRKIVAELPQNLPASLFVVIHIASETRSVLPDILSKAGNLPAVPAIDGQRIRHGHIYVAPPDYHLSFIDGALRVAHGPKENLHRPAIDPMFRSAARWFGNRVIGVVLSGGLDDGTAGLKLIKKRGGITVVQDPNDASSPDMPCHAIENVQIDYRLPASEIGPLLISLTNSGAPEKVQQAPKTELDRASDLMDAQNEDVTTHERELGSPSVFTCPTCHGAIWEVQDGNLLRFQCHVGHAFSPTSMLAEQNEDLERAMWIALRSMDDSVKLLRRLADHSHAAHHDIAARRYQEAADEKQGAADLIRKVLLN